MTLSPASPRANPKGASTLRRVLIFLHLWLGLTCGTIFVLMGLSGSILVFAPELDAVFTPQLVLNAGRPSVTQLHLDTCRAQISVAYPSWKIRSLTLPATPNHSLQWAASPPTGNDRLTIFSDANTCTVLGTRFHGQGFLGWISGFHHGLLLDHSKQWVLGYIAFGILTLVLTGILLWWPSQWTTSRLKFRTAVRPLHYFIGFWLFVPLLLVAVTAIYMGFHDILQPRLRGESPQAITSPNASPKHEHSNNHNPNAGASSLDLALAAARHAQPDATFTSLRLPDAPTGPVAASFQLGMQRGTRQSPNSLTLVPDGNSGQFKVAKTSLLKNSTAGVKTTYIVPMLHYGDLFGLASRILLAFTGLMPGILLTTGFLMWRRRVRSQRTTQ